MSEYQYVAFRAIDGPLNETQLNYVRRQSSRAEITPWSFDNEYHYGDFGGNAVEMLCRGYDFHLHYANFGIRTLMIRLPTGLPDAKAVAPFFANDSLDYLRDKDGVGGILRITPFYEPDQLDEVREFEDLLDSLVPVRGEIINGDLRPVYLAHLAVASDGNHDPDEEREGPVPAGLAKLTHAQRALTGFYGLSDALIAAAARESPPLPEAISFETGRAAWLERQPEVKKTEWLARLLADPHSTVRREILAEFQKSQTAPAWPTVRSDRTITELIEAADKIQRGKDAADAERARRERGKKLARMAADPSCVLRETEQLVKERSRDAYCQIAGALADLREAPVGHEESDLPERQARKSEDAHPTLRTLVSELRSKGFLKKGSSLR